ncbi:MAG: Arc family DNA-binding protein [Peptococcaceae bacterium]|jgi:hypothetical protein|nr:Arc family DNA-binding protein [Peptococcaceae bacterium]
MMDKGQTSDSQPAKEKDKKQMLLRLSPSLWQDLAQWAEDDFRSINGQIEFLLTESVKNHKRSNRNSDHNSDRNDLK